MMIRIHVCLCRSVYGECKVYLTGIEISIRRAMRLGSIATLVHIGIFHVMIGIMRQIHLTGNKEVITITPLDPGWTVQCHTTTQCWVLIGSTTHTFFFLFLANKHGFPCLLLDTILMIMKYLTVIVLCNG